MIPVFSCFFVVIVTLTLALVLFYFTRRTYDGFGLWTIGSASLAVSLLAMLLRGVIPESLSIFVTNGSFLAAMMLYYAGMRRFMGQRPMSQWWFILSIVVAVLIFFFFYVHNSMIWRTLIISWAAAALQFAIAGLLLRRSPQNQSIFCSIIGSLFFLTGVAFVIRGVWVFSEPHFHILKNSPAHVGFFIGMLACQVGETLAFIMLQNERMEAEILEAQARLHTTIEELRAALSEVKTLSGYLPICASCKKIRDDKGYWSALERYIEERSDALFSHGICPDCVRKLYPKLADKVLEPGE